MKPRFLLAGLVALLGLAGVLLTVHGDEAEPVLTVRLSPSTVQGGERITVAITVTNPGPERTLHLTVTLDERLTYLPATLVLEANGRPLDRTPDVDANTLRWSDLPLPGGRPNLRGINTFVQEHCTNTALVRWQLDRARDLTGPNGLVKQLVMPLTRETLPDIGCWARFVNEAYDRGLDVILRVQGRYTGAFWEPPPAEGAPPYRVIANRYRDFVAAMPRRDGRTLYIQVWNEPNLREEWGNRVDPVAYARFFSAVADAVHALGDPRVRVLNAPLAPGGDVNPLAFIDAMVAAVPDVLWKFDAWAAHVYPGNHPPEYNYHDGTAAAGDWATIDTYVLERERLAAWGRPDVPVILSETGYALGFAGFAWQGYPPITEENRAAYMRRAFRDFWSRWPEVRAVAPFELSDPDGRWWIWDWIAPDGTPHAQYTALRALQDTFATQGYLTVRFQVRTPSVSQATLATVGAQIRTADHAVTQHLTHTLLVLPASPPPTPTPSPPSPPSPTPTPVPFPTSTPVPQPTLLALWPTDREPHGLAVDPQNRRLFVSHYTQATLSLLDAATGALLNRYPLPGYWGLHDLVWEPRAAALVASVYLAGGALFLNAGASNDIRYAPSGRGPTRLLAGPEGRVFLLNRLDGTLSVLDAATARRLATLAIGPEPNGLAYDPSTATLAVTTYGDRGVRLVDMATLQVIRTEALPGEPADIVWLSAPGRWLVGDAAAPRLYFGDGATWRPRPAPCPVQRLGWHPAWRHLYVVCRGRPVLYVWDVEAGRALAALPLPAERTGDILVVPEWQRVYLTLPERNAVAVVQDTPLAGQGVRPRQYLPWLVRDRGPRPATRARGPFLGTVNRWAVHPSRPWAYAALPEERAIVLVHARTRAIRARRALPGVGLVLDLTPSPDGRCLAVRYLVAPHRARVVLLDGDTLALVDHVPPPTWRGFPLNGILFWQGTALMIATPERSGRLQALGPLVTCTRRR